MITKRKGTPPLLMESKDFNTMDLSYQEVMGPVTQGTAVAGEVHQIRNLRRGSQDTTFNVVELT